MTWVSISCRISHRASQNPSRPASKATAIRATQRPPRVASSRQRCSRRSRATASGTVFFRGCRSIPGTVPAMSQLDWLISMTATIVASCSKEARDLLRSLGWGIRITPSALITAAILPFYDRLPHSFCGGEHRRQTRDRWVAHRPFGGRDVLVKLSQEPGASRTAGREAGDLRRARGAEGGDPAGVCRELAALPCALDAERAVLRGEDPAEHGGRRATPGVHPAGSPAGQPDATSCSRSAAPEMAEARGVHRRQRDRRAVA